MHLLSCRLSLLEWVGHRTILPIQISVSLSFVVATMNTFAVGCDRARRRSAPRYSLPRLLANVKLGVYVGPLSCPQNGVTPLRYLQQEQHCCQRRQTTIVLRLSPSR